MKRLFFCGMFLASLPAGSQPGSDETPIEYMLTSPLELIMLANIHGNCSLSVDEIASEKNTTDLTPKDAGLFCCGVHWCHVFYSVIHSDPRAAQLHFRAIQSLRPYAGFPDISGFWERLAKNQTNTDSLIMILNDAWFHTQFHMEDNGHEGDFYTVYGGCMVETVYLYLQSCGDLKPAYQQRWLFYILLSLENFLLNVHEHPDALKDTWWNELTELVKLLPAEEKKKQFQPFSGEDMALLKTQVEKMRNMIVN